jgi:hypothetical protein
VLEGEIAGIIASKRTLMLLADVLLPSITLVWSTYLCTISDLISCRKMYKIYLYHAHVSPALRCIRMLAMHRLRCDVHYPLAPRNLIQSTNFVLPYEPTADYPKHKAYSPYLWVLLYRASDSELAQGLNECAIHGGEDGLLTDSVITGTMLEMIPRNAV